MEEVNLPKYFSNSLVVFHVILVARCVSARLSTDLKTIVIISCLIMSWTVSHFVINNVADTSQARAARNRNATSNRFTWEILNRKFESIPVAETETGT